MRETLVLQGIRASEQLITRRPQVRVLPPQPWLATNLDTSPENPETIVVSGFFRIHFEVAKKDTYLWKWMTEGN